MFPPPPALWVLRQSAARQETARAKMDGPRRLERFTLSRLSREGVYRTQYEICIGFAIPGLTHFPTLHVVTAL